MRTYRRTVTTDAAAQDVWAYLADFTTINEWDPRAEHAERVSGDGAVGSRYETDVHFLGRTTRMTYEVTRLEPASTIEWVGDNAVVHAHDLIEVRDEGDRTVVDYTTSYDYRVPRPLEPVVDALMSWPINRLCDDAQRGLGERLATGT